MNIVWTRRSLLRIQRKEEEINNNIKTERENVYAELIEANRQKRQQKEKESNLGKVHNRNLKKKKQNETRN